MCYSYFMRRRNQSTKDNLIPFEKSRKIIKLDKRGRESRLKARTVLAAVAAGLLAVLCLGYCLAIYFFMGYGSRFFLIWGVMALGFGILSVLFARPAWREHIPRFIRRAFWTCAVVGIVLLCIVEGLIFSRFGEKAQSGADYMIVLGAQWKSHGPSYVLQKRLDAAVEYLRENPDTVVIVSGGQGSNEPMTEAAGMAGYLENAGIAPERIMQEGMSTNTSENLEFSAVFLDKAQDSVVIVTNNFHVYRALGIARKKGYAKAEGLSAGSYPAMLPNNLLREFFGVVKDVCVGNMKL
ncbi:MAG: YdcF family protein [Butyrivibrio sp.]|nr:YdcF family protein [Butyrivibrio sp.]